ncbi:LamG-like jellyroll fold domain-containing protein [Robinsoniella peoriensis]|uniref:LamG-like jellyroll fold domain-containing protein n=1 Tax=Robinsoniella peoriensis TaxID=180332 RepID=UPI0005C7CBDF|nr:LamG-like jellyroll fold domain-containing protein [Robinsoniella peoriensis]
MKLKKMVSLLMSTVVLLTTPIPAVQAAAPTNPAPTNPAPTNRVPINLVPTEPAAETANYVCTWNIQDWVAWHESSDKRDVVDPEHLFNEKTGWISTMYPESRGDLIFLLDDGWDLPYGTKKNGYNKEYFGCQVLPDDKFPKAEWGNTPQEKLKTLNEEIKSYGWKGTGIWICAQTSSAYKEYAGKDEEDFWRMRLRWSKYAGISYWKIDWGTEQKKITWRRKISEWAEEEYPELIIEHVVGGRGKNTNNERIEEDLLADNIEFAAFSDVFRTYDVLDNLATAITLDRVGEQLIGGYTETGNAMGLMNAEDELYICASLGLSAGVMRFTPYLTTDSKNSGDGYFGLGTEKDTYFAGGKKFVDTKATRNRLDEVARTVRWQRIAPAYTVGDYDTALSNAYLQDDWTFSSSEPAWDGTKNMLSQKAPAFMARGIDLPTVTVDSGDDIPFLTASRNPNGAISIAAYARTHTNTGYKPVKSAKVTLNAGDLTGKIGVFGYYGSLSLTFNQDLSGKKIYAQDMLATQAQDITSEVQIDGNTLTIDGKLLEEIGLSAATEGDSSDPGLVLQIGEETDFAAPAETNARIERWGVNNGSFENFHYDANMGQTMESVTAADWHRSNNTNASYISEGGYSGAYSGIHTSNSNYEVSTYQLNKSVANGVYKASCYVKASEHSRTAPGGNHKTSAGFYVSNYGGSEYVDIQKMGELNDWTYIEIPQFNVTNGQIQVEFYSYGATGEYLMFDDVRVDYVGEISEEIDANAILEFDFSESATDDSGTTVTGTANGEKVTATAQNVTFISDEDSNDIAVFPADGDNAATGITYIPGDNGDNDPMRELESGSGATIAMWIKTGQDTFSSSLFTYGSRKDAGTGDLGASLQILGRNNIDGDTVFYRNASGSTGGHKVGKVGNPYVKDTWQLVTFVENGDGTGTLYIDGVERGSCGSSDKTLLGFATDGNTPDNYYFGFLPNVSNTDTHFAGAMDSITVYDKAFSEGQVQRLYKERFEEQKEIVLNADGNGVISGQAASHFTEGQGYVGWIGKSSDAIDEEEGTVTFNFNAKEAAEWNMDIYYLSKASSSGGVGANIRDFVVSVNSDTANAQTVTCPEGDSWDDPSAASVITVEKVSLNKGKNTLVFGNPNGNAPSLVKVVLKRADYAAAAEVEDLILSQLGTVDDFAQLSMVQQIREKYDALTEEEKKLVSEEAYKMLLSAEDFMQGFLDQEAADAVEKAIVAIGEEITLEKESEIVEVRAAYEELTDVQKLLITPETLKKLTDAEVKLEELKNQDTKVDKAMLNEAITTAEVLKEADYTVDSWKALETAVKAAREVAADEKATQQEVNDATAAIEAALEALVAAKPEVVVDKKALKDAIVQANAISAEALKQYTDESVRTFKNALAAAVGLSEKASQKEVAAAAAALQAAMKGLVKKPVTPPVVQKEISKLTIGSIKAQTHTGSSLKPIISIKDGSKVLKQDVDYTVYYKNNKNPGTAQIIITGKGTYKGSLTKTFVILAKKGRTYTVGNYKYKVLSASTKSGTVSLTKPVKITLKTVKVPDSVKIGNYRYKVTEIGKSAFKGNKKLKTVKIGKNVKKIGTAAFYNDKALKTITVYSKVIKSVGKNALKGIHARAVIKVPKSKLKSYQSRFAKKGQKETVIIKK